jgi:5,10-methylenetetrahydromethanopterin reductase
MRFGISLGTSPRETFEQTVEIIEEADRLGFDSVAMTDVHLSHKSPWVSLILAAGRTQRIKLGTGVLNPVTRHVAVIANVMSGINELSTGRVFIGLGTGWTSVYSLGLPPASVAQLEEAVTTLRGLLRGEEVVYGGHTFRMTVANGPIPIFVAANQPRMLRAAGRVADGVILMGGANVEFTRWQIEQVARGAEEAGRRMEDIVLDQWFSMSIQDDKNTALDDVRPWVASQAETYSTWAQLPEILKPYEDEFARVARVYNRLDHVSRHAEHKHVVSDELVDLLAVAGPADHCVARLQELAVLGIGRITVALLPGGRIDRLRRMSEEIFPRVGV